MQLTFLDPYRHSNSLLHRADARVKFLLTIAFILTSSLTPVGAWPVYIFLFTLILSVTLLSELGMRFVLTRASLALPFVLSALPIIFTTAGTELFTLPIGTWTLTASIEGLARFVSIALKSWLSVQAAILLASSTPFPELLQAMRAVGIPRLLVAMFGLMWRYLFVLVDEALRLMRARSARSGVSSNANASRKVGGSLVWRARVAGGMAGNLFLRGIERSDRIYVAMLSRGYNGEVHAMPLSALTRGSWLVLWLGLSMLAVLLIFGILLWG
jgi:cobalt/nickel transport system permease protein